MSDKISVESVKINMPEKITTPGKINTPENDDLDSISRLRCLNIEIYHRGGKLSKSSILSLKQTIEQETKKLLLQDQFLSDSKSARKSIKQWVNFHKSKETERRKTVLAEANECNIRESRASEILKELDELNGEYMDIDEDSDGIEYKFDENYLEK